MTTAAAGAVADHEPAVDADADAAGSRPARRLLPDGRTAVRLGLLVLLALVVRIDLLRNTASPIPPAPAVSDAAAYRLLGQGLADGEGYVRPFDRVRDGREVATAEYPPGYPALLAAADVVGISSEDGQRAVLCVLGSLTVGLVGLVARRLGGDGAGYLAAAVAALHPALWSTDTSPLAEPLAAFLGMTAVLAALAVRDRPDAWRWVVLGLLAGLGGLVRAELLLVGPLLLLPLAWRRARDDRRLGLVGAALGLAAMAAVLAPWTIRNAVAFGRFVPVSNNLGSVARGANCDGAYRGEFKGLWVTNVADVGGDDVDPE
ncbi:MAG TPA: glycosyltransferase family 39 protein, partial [Aquihabitans sp.]|nr:glycosyltransferase family 39 protein [Aquihabitans sp.]